jgi:hypothetical protein
MASNWSQIDMQFPNFTGKETTEEKVTRIQNYLFMLMEFLRYSLRNLDSSNFNSAALEEMTESLMEELRAKDGIFENLVTDNLYADFGSIADLTVNSLRTDWKRAQRWLDRDTSDLDYITVRDETMQWVTGTTDGLQEVQLRNHRGEPLYWVDPPPRRAESVTAGVEYEQETSEMPDLIAPVINHVGIEPIDPESGRYKLTVSKDDCTLDPRAEPFFYFATRDGDFEDYTVDEAGSASVVFKAHPDTGGRGIQIITGVGDNLGQIHEKTVLGKDV